MGFFDFLKRKKQAEILKFSDIDSWLNEKINDKELDDLLDKSGEFFVDKSREIHKLLEQLENADLRNDNIPVREKHIMEGHRKAYIQRIKRFIGSLEFPQEISGIGHFSAKFSESLDSLTAETQKNYMVLNHFFANELSQIVRGVQAIKNELPRLQSEIEKKGIDQYKDVKVKLRQYKDDLKKEAVLKEELFKRKTSLDDLKNKKQKLIRKIDDYKKSPEFEKYRDIMDKKKEYEEKLNTISTDLKNKFVEIERALKKYSHDHPEEKAALKYLSDPAEALQDDAGLAINDILRKLRDKLDVFEMDQKQRAKTMMMLEEIDREYITKTKLDLDMIKGMNMKAASFINQSIIALNISETETMVRSVDEKIRNAEGDIKELEIEIAGINHEYLKQKVKDKVKEVANVEVEEEEPWQDNSGRQPKEERENE